MNPLKLSDSTVIRRTKDILFSNLDGEILGIDSHAGHLYSMNETANRVWDMLKNDTTLSDLISRIRAEYDVDESNCREGVVNLLIELHKANLIQMHD